MNSIGASKKISVKFLGVDAKTNENILSQNYATFCSGFTCQNGVLQSQFGIKNATFSDDKIEFLLPKTDSEIVEMHLYRRVDKNGNWDDRLIVATAENLMYQTKLNEQDVWHPIVNTNYLSDGASVNYNWDGRDCLLVCTPYNPLCIIDDENVAVLANAPRFSSLCIHYERVFATDSRNKNIVWFSDDFNPSNWNVDLQEGGYIKFFDESGAVLKVLSFSNYVYVFKEFGIYKISAFAEQTTFSVSKIYVGTGKIFENTIAQNENKILFLSNTGLFVFDGYATKNIAKNIPKIINEHMTKAVIFENKYYLSCCFKGEQYGGQNENNSILIVDLKNGYFDIVSNVNIVCFLPVYSHNMTKLLVSVAGDNQNQIAEITNDGSIFGIDYCKKWVSPKNKMGVPNEKVVRNINFDSNAKVKFNVLLDENRYSYEICNQKRIFVGKKGKKIGFEIETQQCDAEILPFVVEMDLV